MQSIMGDVFDPEHEKRQPGSRYGLPKLRERVVRRLAQAYSEGELDLDDYEERIRRAEHAVTVGELKDVVADFPDPPVTSVSETPDLVSDRSGPFYFTLLGDRDILPDDLEHDAAAVLSIIGDVKVDLSQTRAMEGATFDITSVSLLGDTTVIVPPGTRVIRRQFTLIGDYKRRTRQPEPGTERYTVVLRGFSLIGDVKIREA